jgi:sec-independent protein translocase protein TatB
MFGINPMELMIILMVALIVVGPKRLPEIGRTIGRAFSELRRVQEEVRDTIRFDLEDDEPEPPTRPVRRERSSDSPRTPSAAELASAGERERTEVPASEPDGRPQVASEVAPEVAPEVASDGAPDAAPDVAPDAAPDVAPNVAGEAPAHSGGEPGDPAPSGLTPGDPAAVVEEDPAEGPIGAVEPADADSPSPNGSPKRPARDEAG